MLFRVANQSWTQLVTFYLAYKHVQELYFVIKIRLYVVIWYTLSQIILDTFRKWPLRSFTAE